MSKQSESALSLLTSGSNTKKTVGYCCIPDIKDPVTLLEDAISAEKAGFKAIWVSDHFHPWSHTGAHEFHTWVWMSMGLERTKKVPFGTAITAPLFRYHPAIVAQAFATMESVHRNRVMLGVATGEAMNEVPLGIPWPSMKERRERLVESIEIMKKLWQTEFVSFRGKYYTLNGANLYMKATVPIFVAGFGEKMAKTAGAMGEGFLTVVKPLDYIKSTLFPAVEKGARSVGRTLHDITKVLEIDMSYDEDYDRALASLRFWAPSLLEEPFIQPISDPRELENLGRKITDDQLSKSFLIGTTPEEHIKRIEEAFNVGFDHVYVQSNSPDERKCIEMYEKKVLPYFHTAPSS